MKLQVLLWCLLPPPPSTRRAAPRLAVPRLADCLSFSPVVALVANGGQEGVVFDRQQNWIYCKTLKESILTLLQWARRSQSPVALRMYLAPPATAAAVAAAAKDGNMCNF
jgi:hypothetical protein